MFGVSFLELVVIGVVALLVFGPEKLPEIARWVGKISGEFRKTSNALRREFYNAIYEPAQADLDRTRRELSNLKSELLTPFKDAGAGLNRDLKAVGDDLRSSAANGATGPAIAAPKKPEVPVPSTPLNVQTSSTPSPFDRESGGDS